MMISCSSLASIACYYFCKSPYNIIVSTKQADFLQNKLSGGNLMNNFNMRNILCLSCKRKDLIFIWLFLFF